MIASPPTPAGWAGHDLDELARIGAEQVAYFDACYSPWRLPAAARPVRRIPRPVRPRPVRLRPRSRPFTTAVRSQAP